MSKAASYLDWELSLKKKDKATSKPSYIKKETNSLGISETSFKNFLNDWKKKNLL